MNNYLNEYKTSKKYICAYKTAPYKKANNQSFLLVFLERILSFLDKTVSIAKSKKIISAVKMIIGVICFFAFLGILGSLEAGTLSGSFAISASLLIVFVELLCIIK